MSEIDDVYTEVDNEQVAEPTPEPEPEPLSEPEPEPVEETKPETEGKTTVPKDKEWTLTAVMDEREKRQEAVRRAEELEKRLAELQPKEDDISVFEDEQGWKQQQEKRLQESIRNNSLNMSQAFAEEVFGEDEVAAATAWMQNEGIKSPHVVSQFNSAKLPFHEAVKMYRAEQDRLNPDAYRAKLKAEILEELKAEKSGKAPEPDITPSLASSRSATSKSADAENPEDMLNP